MPVVLEGNCVCEKCEKGFDWAYLSIPKVKLNSGVARPETVPQRPLAYRVETAENNAHRVYVNCPHCGYENIFICENP